MAYEINERRQESVYSVKVKAGKKRTYFFDVRATRGNDFFLTITESIKRFDQDAYDRHKIFVYKEDFNKFIKGLTECVDFVKTELMPNFDFDSYNHEYAEGENTLIPAVLQEPLPDVAEQMETENIAMPAENALLNASIIKDKEVEKW